MEYFGGIEAGGTKFICIIGSSPNNILSECRIETIDPHNTLRKVEKFFIDQMNTLGISLKSIGIGCFGPLDLEKNSDTLWINNYYSKSRLEGYKYSRSSKRSIRRACSY